MATGFQAINGQDLDSLFAAGSGGAGSGFQLADGRDLGSVFAPVSQGSAIGFDTGFLAPDGQDLRWLYAGAGTLAATVTLPKNQINNTKGADDDITTGTTWGVVAHPSDSLPGVRPNPSQFKGLTINRLFVKHDRAKIKKGVFIYLELSANIPGPFFATVPQFNATRYTLSRYDSRFYEVVVNTGAGYISSFPLTAWLESLPTNATFTIVLS